MAINDSDAPGEEGELLDEDGDSSDWIEIANPTDQAVSLGGWYLTDDRDVLAKWSFPSNIMLEPGRFLVLFASGKDRKDSAGILHTNFKLSGDGEYLALVLPDGVTVAHAFSPAFPGQIKNVSYGLTSYAETLVPSSATAAYHVPTASDAEVDWTSPEFDASNWTMGQMPFGFFNEVALMPSDVGSSTLPGRVSVTEQMYSIQAAGGGIGGTADSFYYLSIPLTGDGEFTARVKMIFQTHDLAKAGVMIRESLDGGSKHASQLMSAGRGAMFQRRVSTQGESTSDEINDMAAPYWVRIVRQGNRFSGYVSSDGDHWVLQGSDVIPMSETVYVGLCAASHDQGTYTAAAIDEVAHSGRVATDLMPDMLNQNGSLWTRLAFNLEPGQAEMFDLLNLNLRYQDGYIAYLNGHEVARHLAPATVLWDSQATAQRQQDEVGKAEAVNLLPFLSHLKPGKNVVAIQGLNDDLADEGFLLAPELIAASHRHVPQYFTTPTPGAINKEGSFGQVHPVTFSQTRGFYDAAFELILSTETEGSDLFITRDGSLPTAMNGKRYVAPLLIEATTTVRVVAVKPGYLDSKIDTQTFIFVNDVKTQSADGSDPGGQWPSGSVNGQILDYGMDPDVVEATEYRDLMSDALLAIPSVSLVTNLSHLFDRTTGIYVNPGQEGRAWERPVSVELINPDGSEGFQIDAGMRIRGGFSRTKNNPKHSFRLFFRGEYGPSSLQFPLFGEEGTDEFDNLDLRTAQNYAWSLASSNPGHKNTLVREVLCRDLQREMGKPYTRSRYYHVYINGQYWGLYQSQERSEASYAEDYFGGLAEDYDVIKADGYRTSYTDGSIDLWNALWYLCEAGFTTDEAYYAVQGKRPDGTPDPDIPVQLDVENLIDYMLGIFFTGNDDAPVTLSGTSANNFFALRNRRPESRQGWIFFAYDNEHSLGVARGVNDDRTQPVTAGQSIQHFNPQWLHQKLMDHPEYRSQFADRAHLRFFNNGVLTPENAILFCLERALEIDLAIIAESARWGDQRSDRSRNPYTKADWWAEVNGYLVNTYFPQRSDIVLSQLTNRGLYASLGAPVCYVNGQPLQDVALALGDQVSMTASTGAIWYTADGSDPRHPYVAGESSTSSTPLVNENQSKRALVPSGPIHETWKSDPGFDDASWISGTRAVGYDRGSGYETSIGIDVQTQMYAQQASCYVRIPFVLSDDPGQFNFLTLKARYDDGFVAYLNGVEVHRVNINGSPQWNSVASGNHEAEGLESFDITDHLNVLRQGENILALQGVNVSMSSSDFIVSAALMAGERTGPTGGGVSGTAIPYTGPFTLDQSCKIKSRVLNGSQWSALNEAVFSVSPVVENLRITEIMYHPADVNDPNTEYIELQNIGIEPVSLNLVRFTKGIKIEFPKIMLNAGEYVLVVKDMNAFEDAYGYDLNIAGQYTGSLANSGERLRLEDALGEPILDFEYNDWINSTDGRGFSLTLINPTESDLASWNLKDSWRASPFYGGSPGWD